MKNLEERNLISLVKQVEKPLLGICLGMQLLGKFSQEKGQKADAQVECLGLCEGEVKLMQTGELPLPHMGWNTVKSLPDIRYLKALKKASISILCIALPCLLVTTLLRNVIMVSRSAPRCKVVTIMGCNFTLSVQAARAQNLSRIF